tara:strand:+ start:435 stop:2093 length:1659 start_codon:yes stop_codon:yes gene_type:complete
MSITSNNKTSFKNWVKEYQDIFGPGHLVKDYMGLVNQFLTSSESGVTTKLDQPVNIVLWDFDETIDLTGSLREGEYYYFPAIPEDKVRIKNGSSTYTMNFDADGKWNGKSLGSIQTIGDKKIKLVGIGGTLVQTQVSPTYAISEDKTAVNEGETVTFTVTTTNIANGSTITWTTVGTTDNNDFSDNSTSGSVAIQNNTATITRTLSNDLTVSEGAENFQIRIYSGSTTLALSSSIAVADTSAATYSLAGAAAVVEGNSVTYTITTSGVPDGTNLYFTTSLYNSDISPTSGNITINSNTATFTIAADIDYKTEGNETLTVSLRTNGTNGPVVATTSTTLSDKPFTITLTPAATSINESTSATSNIIINVASTDVADGTTFRAYPVASGGSTITFGDGGDFDASYYNFTIQNNAATITIPVTRDGRTEGSEDVIIQVKDLTYNNVVASTPAITINDTSYIGLNFTDKTFGPIDVNRDGGVTSNASDWYTICGLDKLPDGAKIAIFVDISGSMTMNTIQASYDLLISKLQARNMDIITVQNQDEDWITPFDQILT